MKIKKDGKVILEIEADVIASIYEMLNQTDVEETDTIVVYSDRVNLLDKDDLLIWP